MKGSEIRTMLWQQEIARKNYIRPYLVKMGLTVGQGQPRILKNLLVYGPQTQRELADRCLLDVTTMSRTLDRMEAAGLLEREDNPACRRSYLIRLTPAGEEKAKQVQEVFRQCDEIMLRGLSEQEQETLCAFLQTVAQNLEEAGKEESK